MSDIQALLQDMEEATRAILRQIAKNAYPWMIPDDAKGRQMDSFTYPVEWLPIAAGDTEPLPFQVDNSAAFIIESTTAVVTAEDDVTFLANKPFLVNLKDTGSGRDLMSTPVHIDNLFGTAQRPFFWQQNSFMKVMAPSSTLQVTLTNLDQTNAYNVRVAFSGIKVMDYKPTETARRA